MRYLIVCITLAIAVLWLPACQKKEPYEQGRLIYNHLCGNCHGEDGAGLRKLYPPLADSDYLRDNWSDLSCIIRHGLAEEIVVNGITYNQAMPGIPETQLSPDEIANIINYIRYTWYPDQDFVARPGVEAALLECE